MSVKVTDYSPGEKIERCSLRVKICIYDGTPNWSFPALIICYTDSFGVDEIS